MKRKTGWALALAAVLVLGLCTGAAAVQSPILTLCAPQTLPAVGEQCTVTVRLDECPGILSAECVLAFDADVVQCTAIKTGTALRGMLTAVNAQYAPDAAKLAAASASAVTSTGTVATFTFTVLAAGDADFSLRDVLLSGTDGAAMQPVLRQDTPQMPDVDDAPDTDDVPEADDEDADDAQDTAVAETDVDEPARFSDVVADFWGADVIARAAALGLVDGFSDGTFRPNAAVTRAQFVTMLWRMAGKPTAQSAALFSDVPANAWYHAALDWAVEQGCVSGVGGGKFAPDGSVTREQAAAMLFRYHGSPQGIQTLFTDIYRAEFSDSGALSAWAEDAAWWAVYHEILAGTGGRLMPQAAATRVQIAAMLLRDLEAGEEMA